MTCKEGENERMARDDRFTVPLSVHLIVRRDREILLLRRCNTGYEDGSYSLVAGHLDGGEPVLAAASREACEEAGVMIDPASSRIVQVMHRQTPRDEYIDFFVEVMSWDGVVTNCEPEKCDDLGWFPMDSLPENMVPYVRHALEVYATGQWSSAFGWETG